MRQLLWQIGREHHADNFTIKLLSMVIEATCFCVKCYTTTILMISNEITNHLAQLAVFVFVILPFVLQDVSGATTQEPKTAALTLGGAASRTCRLDWDRTRGTHWRRESLHFTKYNHSFGTAVSNTLDASLHLSSGSFDRISIHAPIALSHLGSRLRENGAVNWREMSGRFQSCNFVLIVI